MINSAIGLCFRHWIDVKRFRSGHVDGRVGIGPILETFRLIVFFNVGQHNDDFNTLLPGHAPEVENRRLHWALSTNELFTLFIAHDEISVDIVRIGIAIN